MLSPRWHRVAHFAVSALALAVAALLAQWLLEGHKSWFARILSGILLICAFAAFVMAFFPRRWVDPGKE